MRLLLQFFSALLFSVLIPGILLPGLAAVGTPSLESPQVLVLHSYDPQHPWTRDVMEGMLEVLSQGEPKVSLHVEYFDTNRYHSSEYLDKFLVETMQHKLENADFDLILLSDNDALEFILTHRDELIPEVPVVFCGINGFDSYTLEDQEAITGVLEAPDFEQNIATAVRLHPQAEEIIVIGATDNLTDLLNDAQLREALQSMESIIPYRIWNDLPLEELTVRFSSLESNHLILVGATTFHDESGRSVQVSDAMDALRAAARRPMYGFWDFYLGKGIVGGSLVSGREQGRQAALMGRRILSGESPESIPVMRSGANRRLFDWNELGRLGIQVEDLPPASHLINNPSDFYELHSSTFWGGLILLVALGALVLLLLRNSLSRSRAQRTLQEQTLFLSEVLDAIPIPFYYKDGQGRYLGTNRASEEFFGIAASSFVGRSVEDLFPPDYAEFVAASDDELMRRGGVQSFSTRLRDGQGQMRNVLFHKTAFKDSSGALAGLVGTMVDFTELKQVQEELTKRERKYGALFDTSLDGIAIVNRAGRFEDANRAFLEMVGYQSSELMEKNWKFLIVDRDRERIAELFSRPLARRGFTDEIELELMRRDGSSFPGRLRTWVDEEQRGRPRRFLTIIRDVTESRKLDQLKEEMLSMVSHEMRTPLTAMMGYTEFLLENQSLDLEQRQGSLRTIRNETLRLKDLIDNLLDLQSIRSGRVSYRIEPMYLSPMLMESARLFDKASANHQVELELPAEFPQVPVDEAKIRQVVNNLLSNAIKYSPAGGQVTLGACVEQRGVRIWVKDQGVGIEPDAMPQIFDSFYRIDNSDRRRIGGTGLGLALVREVVKAHGGEVLVESTPGQGSVFSVVLPL